MKKHILFGMVAFSLLCAGCKKEEPVMTAVAVEKEAVTTEEIAATGSYQSMGSTYDSKYKVTYYTKTTGHPSADADFATDHIVFTDAGKEYVFIDYNGYVNHKIEEDYQDYESMKEIQIGDKTYKYFADGDNAVLLYKVDDNFYVRVDVHGASQYNSEGSEIDVTETPAMLVENGKMNDAITFDVEF